MNKTYNHKRRLKKTIKFNEFVTLLNYMNSFVK